MGLARSYRQLRPAEQTRHNPDRGIMPYFAKVIHVFFDMDKMVGGDFEAGLAKLKMAAEK